MADVMPKETAFRAAGSGAYEAQETGEPPDTPDIKRPPDQPDHGDEERDTPDDPAAPPFTGEDVEDVGRRKRDRPLPM